MRPEVDRAIKASDSRMVPLTLHVHDKFGMESQSPLLNKGPIDGFAFIVPEMVHLRSKERSHASLERSVITQPESDGGVRSLSERCQESVCTGESMVAISFGDTPADKTNAG